jgi:hypothetical protein
MKSAIGIALSAFVGGVSYFLSLGFVLPPGAEGFRFFATFGAISGFGVGSALASRLKAFSLIGLGLLIAANLLVGWLAAVTFMLMVSTGSIAGLSFFAFLSFLLSVTFFCLGVALPLAGLSFAHSSDP